MKHLNAAARRPVPGRVVLLLLLLASDLACRSADELSALVTAEVHVIGLSEDRWVELSVNDQLVGTQPRAEENLVTFSLVLPAGSHHVDIVVYHLETEQEDEDDDDDGEEWWPRRPREEHLEAERCGTLPVEIPATAGRGEVTSVAVVVADLPRCEGDD